MGNHITMMKTVLIQEQVGTLPYPRALFPSPSRWNLRPCESVRDWLPAPVVPRNPCPVKSKAAPTQSNIWIALPRELVLENVFYGLLVVAVMIGVAYGFSSLLDLVHNWASINASLEHMIQ